MGALLRASGVGKRFGAFAANDGIDLELEVGEIKGLIGPNGAGKTTFANVLTGIVPPSSGEIEFAGERLTRAQPHVIARRGLARTFQVSRLFDHLSVHDNFMVAALASRPFAASALRTLAARRIDELLTLSKLNALAAAPAGSLSGGQRALAQLCVGFMMPGLRAYILDEPFAGINPVIKATICDLIEYENRANGTAFLVISHEMDVVRRLCSSVTVLIAGKVFTQGTLAAVVADPAVIDAYLGKSGA